MSKLEWERVVFPSNSVNEAFCVYLGHDGFLVLEITKDHKTLSIKTGARKVIDIIECLQEGVNYALHNEK